MASQPWVLEGRRKAERGYGREGEWEPHQDSHIHESLGPGAHVRAEMPSGLPMRYTDRVFGARTYRAGER